MKTKHYIKNDLIICSSDLTTDVYTIRTLDNGNFYITSEQGYNDLCTYKNGCNSLQKTLAKVERLIKNDSTN